MDAARVSSRAFTDLAGEQLRKVTLTVVYLGRLLTRMPDLWLPCSELPVLASLAKLLGRIVAVQRR